MKKLFSMSVLILVALIAFHQPCAVAQDTAVDDTIASILNDVETEPVAVVATEPVIENSTEAAVDAEPVVLEETPRADATAETVNEDVVAEPEVATPAADEMVKSELPIQVIKNGHEPSIADADGVVRVSMDFEQSPLPDVVRAFRDASGANIISGWTNTTPRLVSVRLNNVEWSMGLSAIVASYGLELKEDPRGSSIYVIREKITLMSELPLFTETFELKHARADDISAIFKNTLGLADLAFDATNAAARANSATRSKSITAAFPSANIVVVKGTEEELESCRSIVAALDIPTRQVYIEARFARLNSTASKKLGMRWDTLSEFGGALSDVKWTFGKNSGTSSDTAGTRSKYTSATGVEKKQGYTTTKNFGTTDSSSKAFGGVLSITDLNLTMSAFEQIDGAQIFSNPKIIVENGTTATVDMTTKEPNIRVTTTPATEYSGAQTSSELWPIPGKVGGKIPWVQDAFFSYGITLDVTPRISPSGLITVEIVPSISQKVDEKIMADGNQYPIIDLQSLDTTFTMNDGKTAVIGGLTETRENNTDAGIPLLRNIPWVGPRLFGWKSRKKEQYEIIVFVSVGIIDGTDIAHDAGMPKNAVIGRGLLDGSLKEPSDRTDEEMFNLETKTKGFRIK